LTNRFGTPYLVCHFIQFDFWERDTLVFTKPLYLDTHTRDQHFKSRLIETVKKEIVQSPGFALTGWNKRAHFNYSYVLQDKARLLHWINPKSILTLFEIVQIKGNLVSSSSSTFIYLFDRTLSVVNRTSKKQNGKPFC